VHLRTWSPTQKSTEVLAFRTEHLTKHSLSNLLLLLLATASFSSFSVYGHAKTEINTENLQLI